MSLGDRLSHAWNAFRYHDQNQTPVAVDYGVSYSSRPDRNFFGFATGKTLIPSIYTWIAIDVSELMIRHVRLDENRNYTETIFSGLNTCLTLESNLDQSARHFLQDCVTKMFSDGVVAIVPVETTSEPINSNAYDVLSMRAGTILEWYPEHVKVRLYNEKTGRKEDLVLPKKMVAIAENPLYSVMNEPNSTLQRLIHKLNLLDRTDEQLASGKLDIIIQLPYVIKTEARRQQAEARRKDIEMQLQGSSHGIAYTDGTEKITQLNRPAENTMLEQVNKLQKELYSQLGMSPAVFEGTADEAAYLNYFNRTVSPVASAITDAIERKFLSKTARTQGQAIRAFRNPFALVPVKDLASILDVLSRNEIVSSNEGRGIIGYKPIADPMANELKNKNMPESGMATDPMMVSEQAPSDGLIYPDSEELSQFGGGDPNY